MLELLSQGSGHATGSLQGPQKSQSLWEDAGGGQENEVLCFSRPAKLLFFNLGSVLLHAG